MRNKSRKTDQILYSEIGSNAELERAEEVLAERENRLRTILETAPQCVKLIDRDGTLLEMNRAGLAIIEADGPEQVIGKNVLGIVNPAYRPAIDALIDCVFSGGTGRAEYEITGLKGTRRWLEMNAVPLRNKNNEITAFLGITNEITDRKRAEEALRLLLEVTAAANQTENIHDMMSRCLEKICQLKGWQIGQAWLLDDNALISAPQSFYTELDAAQFREASLKTRFEKGVGLPGRILESKSPTWVADITKDENFPRMPFAIKIGLKAAFAFPIKLGEELLAVFEFFTPELREPDSHFLDAVEKLGGHLGIVFGRMRAEEALRESEERYRTLFETAPDTILVFDLNRIITMVNQSGVTMYGVERTDELIGKNVYELIIPQDRPRAIENAKELLRTGSARNIEFTALKKDGTFFFVEWSASVVMDAEGRPKTIIGVNKDITRHKRAEEEIKVSHEQLRALSARIQSMREEERTQLAREIHDELGQSLTALKMDLSWMQKRLAETDGAARPLVLEKIKSMHGLIDTTIQSVRKISTELRPVVLDQLGLAAAIEWQAEDFQARSEIKCIVSLYSEDIDLDQVRSTTIFRIFQEILTNVARHANATEIKISLKEDTGNLILEVMDNGKGITQNEISNTMSLGLLGMRERTLLLGGEFTISGESQKGTTVVLKVPLSQQ